MRGVTDKVHVFLIKWLIIGHIDFGNREIMMVIQ